ncbi:MAG: transposase, partial [Nitrososphaera sp.]|nr:transposase [Nitrososphaera sp.]
MSAQMKNKSIAKQTRRVEQPRHQVAGRGATDADVVALREELKKVKAQNEQLEKEFVQLKKEMELWSSEAEKQEDLRRHWHDRYFRRDQEAIELAGLLSLRDARIAELEKEVKQKNARIKELLAKLTDNVPSSEKGSLDKKAKQHTHRQKKRKRGRQEGDPGHGRHDHENLPIRDERITDVSDSDKVCPDCGKALREAGAEESYEVEIEVKGYRRKHRRKKYGHFCDKKRRWLSKTAPLSPKLWPRAAFGITVWVFLLIGKFVLHTPIHRICTQLLMAGISISEGTIVAGFMRIEKLIDPLIDDIIRYSREDKNHWHIDDTGWKVFVTIDEKTGFGWYLWVFLSNDVCVFVISPSRGRKVPQSHLENSVGVATSDRLAS